MLEGVPSLAARAATGARPSWQTVCRGAKGGSALVWFPGVVSGVRQCFALPLLFGCFPLYFPSVSRPSRRQQKPRNNSGRAKHCRTPEPNSPKQKEKPNDLAAFQGVPQAGRGDPAVPPKSMRVRKSQTIQEQRCSRGSVHFGFPTRSNFGDQLLHLLITQLPVVNGPEEGRHQ